MAFFFVAWLFYPPENRFSILTHTFSFLGSFESRHNPRGFVFFSVGLLWLSLLFVPPILYRHQRLAAIWRGPARAATVCFLIGCAGLVGVALVPDARQDFLQDLSYGQVHNKAALLAYLGFLAAMTLDALVYARDRWFPRPGPGPRLRHRIAGPCFVSLAAVVGSALYFLSAWETRYPALHALNPQIKHWPGVGLYSFPLWEWIVLVSFLAALYVLLLSLPREVPRAQGREGPANPDAAGAA